MALSLVDGAGYRVAVTPAGGPITAGVPTTLAFTITDPKGAPVRDLEVVHEMLMHLRITSADLAGFAHEHPERSALGDFAKREFAHLLLQHPMIVVELKVHGGVS
mgnify:CR=1 FL=1